MYSSQNNEHNPIHAWGLFVGLSFLSDDDDDEQAVLRMQGVNKNGGMHNVLSETTCRTSTIVVVLSEADDPPASEDPEMASPTLSSGARRCTTPRNQVPQGSASSIPFDLHAQNRDPPPYPKNMPAHTCSRCGSAQETGPLRSISLNQRRRPIHTVANRSQRQRCRGISCAACDHPACLLCGLDHENLEETSCAEDDDYGNLAASGDGEGASRLRIARECKACPGCSARSWKDGGCDAMTCLVCFTQWCWGCRATYGSRGAIRHGRGCRMAQAGRLDVHDKNLSLEELIAGWTLGETKGFQIDTVIISGPEDLSDKEN
ncbi:uncharacterized protein K489DRAFT_401843 [Dissoconium aciculare CBS 342.82]|uniref:RING-type domain-containing protein n=1 Tax=Dissoconium aciculare CBS 342.82 TaxID=1314786 RepID=A0A6J3M5C9_9PEZI|nr:uncharacterized protein K489DRAFT_401843 [Dissoconium aciculare CBS 342.82]KAF1822047.1 hypothetical protein K489DRAFT_401843 [Dissoconium aciculare CBS 342.82]